MTLSDTCTTYQQARQIGFSRRDILKYAALASGAMIVAACSGGEPASQPLKKLAQGTWKVTVTKSLSSESTSTSAPPPQDFTVTVGDGNYAATPNSWVPESGTWSWSNGGTVQIAANQSGVATGVPESMTSSAQLGWQYASDRFAVQASWDSGNKTLILVGVDGDGNPLPINAVKQ